jgi:hypothetical protein
MFGCANDMFCADSPTIALWFCSVIKTHWYDNLLASSLRGAVLAD